VVFGIFIDVPLLTVPFILMLVFRKRFAGALVGTGVPRMVLYLLLCVPLIVFEEQIDCMKEWCGRVVIPPTLPFLWVELLVLGLLVTFLHSRRPLRVALVFSTYGVAFELLLGGLRGAPLIVTLLLIPYVGLGYAFVSMLPLVVLLSERKAEPQHPP
jgi:hypothetical protein